jgi:hypothetical protein
MPVDQGRRSAPTQWRAGSATMQCPEVGRKATTMDPYNLTKMLEYNQQELARLRGQRNWVKLFRR